MREATEVKGEVRRSERGFREKQEKL